MSDGSLRVEAVEDPRFMEELWRDFSRLVDRPRSWFPWTSFTEYEEWKSHLHRGVGSFWTCQEERVALLAAYRNQEARAVVRVIETPIYPWEREQWIQGDFRGEIQDLLGDEEGQVALANAAVRMLKEIGLTNISASAWREDQGRALLKAGFRPFARSVLLGWPTTHTLRKSNEAVKIEFIERGGETVVQEIFSANWGFKVTVVPRMEIQQPLVAFVRKEPAGTVLLNTRSGNLDLGIQVLEAHRRSYVGSELAKRALEYFRGRGFAQMFVIRNLPSMGLRESDEAALQFYQDTGARVLREYTGLQFVP